MGDYGPKQLLNFHEKSLLRHTAEIAAESKCSPLIAVLGFHHELMARELIGIPFHVVVNENYDKGMGTSISSGIHALIKEENAPDTVLLMLCDQPLITTDHLNKLVSLSESNDNLIIASEYDGILGVPALFKRPIYPQLLELTGEQGAKAIIRNHKSQVLSVAFIGGSVDIDSKQSYDDFLNNNR
jgi:molybdenum cofactor cytidylyltransferase